MDISQFVSYGLYGYYDMSLGFLVVGQVMWQFQRCRAIES